MSEETNRSLGGRLIQWLTTNERSFRRTSLQSRYAASVEEAADLAAERIALKQDYGSIVEEAADVAQELQQTKEEKLQVVEQMVDLLSERTTDRQTVFHLLKGNMGPGCLSLPWAFSQLGIPLGIFMTLLIGLWTYSNCVTVLDFKASKTSGRRTVTYSDLGEVAYGPAFRSMLTGSIVLLQMAICTVYLSFVSANIQAFVQQFFPNLALVSEYQPLSVIAVVPVAVGLTLMPNLKALGPISEVAMIVLFAAFGVLAVILIENWEHTADTPSITGVDWAHAPMAICGILYTFEGICIVLPLEGAMKDRSDFRPMFRTVYAFITIFYIFIGSLCVWILGRISDGSITAFLSSHADAFVGQDLVVTANLLVSLAVLFSYALAMFPCIELWCQALERKERGDVLEANEEEDDWWGGSMAYGPYDTPGLRLSLVAATVVAAIAIPNVQQLIGLAGAVAGALTALVVPPMLALRHQEGFSWQVAFDYLLLALGIVFGAVGAFASLMDIIRSWFPVSEA